MEELDPLASCQMDYEAQEWGACLNGALCRDPNHRGWFPDRYVGQGCQFTAGSLACVREPCPNPLHRGE
jgi:hypothetical protein